MAIAIDPNEAINLVIKSDKDLPKEEQTIFRIYPMTQSEVRKIMSRGEEEYTVNELIDWLQRKLAGWKNFRTASGKVVKFILTEDGKCAPENLDHISFPVLKELFEGITGSSILSSEEVKNLNSGH